MINLESITFENFLGFGSHPTTIILNNFKTTLITGPNGAGKSTLIDAISFCWFNSAFRKINKGTVVNSINGKKCLVSSKFSIGTDRYIVNRGIKPNIFEIWKNDVLIDQSAANKDYQKLLEENILGLNYKSFTQICIMANAGFQPFLQLSAADRRIIIEDLLDIKTFSAMSKIAKEKTLLLSRDIISNQSSITQFKDKIETLTNFIQKVENEERVKDEETDNKIYLLENEIGDLECKNLVLNADKQDLYATINDAPEVTSKKNEVNLAAQKLLHVKNSLISEHQFLNNNDVCQTCKQDISSDFKAQKVVTLSDAIAKRENALKQAKTTIKLYDERLAEINSTVNKIKLIDSDINDNTAQIKNINWQISRLRNDKSKPIVSIEDERKILVEANNGLLKAIDDKNLLIEERNYLDIVNIMLKDNGIKSSIVKQYVPILNTFINYYLEKMGMFVKFTFDENFGDVIQLRHRDNLSYNNLSEGQKRRVDLAVIFAFRKIAESKNICHTNLIFFDDILSTIDCDGVESISAILETFENKNVFVISHEELDGFERNIKVAMKNNYSILLDN